MRDELTKATKVEENWKSRGFSFGIWEDLPGTIWENYVHHEDELFMLAEGNVTLILHNKMIKPAIGEEIFIPAGIVHTVKTNPSSKSRWYYGYSKFKTE